MILNYTEKSGIGSQAERLVSAIKSAKTFWWQLENHVEAAGKLCGSSWKTMWQQLDNHVAVTGKPGGSWKNFKFHSESAVASAARDIYPVIIDM